tara:strand:- start:1928 stop:2326 length:399 start_codon:yes stop_codon:yes gene_type:complete
MGCDELIKMWAEDQKIDENDIGHECSKVSQLHVKYWEIYMKEYKSSRAFEYRLSYERSQKYDYYKNDAPELLTTKDEILRKVDSDPYICEQKILYAEQESKVALLEDIIKIINNRSYLLNTMVSYLKFQRGD